MPVSEAWFGSWWSALEDGGPIARLLRRGSDRMLEHAVRILEHLHSRGPGNPSPLPVLAEQVTGGTRGTARAQAHVHGLNIGHLTDVSGCNLQQYLSCNRRRVNGQPGIARAGRALGRRLSLARMAAGLTLPAPPDARACARPRLPPAQGL